MKIGPALLRALMARVNRVCAALTVAVTSCGYDTPGWRMKPCCNVGQRPNHPQQRLSPEPISAVTHHLVSRPSA